MKTTVNVSDFRDAFRQAGRQDQFSYEGLGLLFNHLEEIEQDTREEMELDVVAICCDFSEDMPKDIAAYHNIDIEDCGDDEAAVEKVVLEYLEENTQVVGVTSIGLIVYYQF